MSKAQEYHAAAVVDFKAGEYRSSVVKWCSAIEASTDGLAGGDTKEEAKVGDGGDSIRYLQGRSKAYAKLERWDLALSDIWEIMHMYKYMDTEDDLQRGDLGRWPLSKSDQNLWIQFGYTLEQCRLYDKGIEVYLALCKWDTPHRTEWTKKCQRVLATKSKSDKATCETTVDKKVSNVRYDLSPSQAANVLRSVNRATHIQHEGVFQFLHPMIHYPLVTVDLSVPLSLRHLLRESKLDLCSISGKGLGLRALTNFRRGDFIFEEVPWLVGSVSEVSCARCGQCLTKTVPCSSCTYERYCSAECRDTAWRVYHAPLCGANTREFRKMIRTQGFSTMSRGQFLFWKVLGFLIQSSSTTLSNLTTLPHYVLQQWIRTVDRISSATDLQELGCTYAPNRFSYASFS